MSLAPFRPHIFWGSPYHKKKNNNLGTSVMQKGPGRAGAPRIHCYSSYSSACSKTVNLPYGHVLTGMENAYGDEGYDGDTRGCIIEKRLTSSLNWKSQTFLIDPEKRGLGDSDPFVHIPTRSSAAQSPQVVHTDPYARFRRVCCGGVQSRWKGCLCDTWNLGL